MCSAQTYFARGIRNIDVIEGDLFSMRTERMFDAMVFCFFGRVEETLRVAKAQCMGTVYMIKKTGRTTASHPARCRSDGLLFSRRWRNSTRCRCPIVRERFQSRWVSRFARWRMPCGSLNCIGSRGTSRKTRRDRVKQLPTTTNSEAFPFFLSAEQRPWHCRGRCEGYQSILRELRGINPLSDKSDNFIQRG